MRTLCKTVLDVLLRGAVGRLHLRCTISKPVLPLTTDVITLSAMTTITCKVSEKLAAQLDTLARVERRSKSALMREALEARLKAQTQRGPTTAFDLVKHLCGSIKGGPSDLATNPKHLKGFGE